VDISKENIIFNKQSEINNSKVSIKLTDNKIIVSIPKNLILDYKMDEAKFYDCGLKKSNNNFQIDNSIYVKSEKGGSICFAFNAPLIEQRYGYLIKINSQNISGRKLFFYILDATKKQGYVEARLDNGTEYFLLSPRYRYGLGYSFNFQNNSYENLVSSNLINELQIYSIPTDDVKSLVLNNNNQNVRETMLSDSFTTKKNTYYSYSIDSLITKPGTIILNQSYHDGWNAYINGKKIKNHVLVNNWANGWVLDENAKGDVKIVFWPQYLEYFGFFLVFLAFVWVLTRKNNA
jgi:hypothetical protein